MQWVYCEHDAPAWRHPVRARTRLPLLTLLLWSAACSGLGLNFREPNIQLDHAVVQGIGLTGGNLDLVVKVENPNNF